MPNMVGTWTRAWERRLSLLHISYDDLQKGGYRIYTAMDQRMQSTAEALFADAEKTFRKMPPTVLCRRRRSAL